MVKILLKRPKTRRWIEVNRPNIQVSVQRQIMADMATALLIQNPQLLQDLPFPRVELFKALQPIAKKAARAIVENLKLQTSFYNPADENNKKALNNKILSANKKWVAVFEAMRQSYAQKDLQKKLRKLLKYLAAAETKKAAAMAAMIDANNQTYENAPTPAPQSTFSPALSFLSTLTPKTLSAAELKICLSLLGLKAGATHQQVKDAFSDMVKEFSQKLNPTAKEQNQIMEAAAAQNILLANDNSRLENLPQEALKELSAQPIIMDEMKQFAQKLNLKLDQPYPLNEIEAKFIEYGIANAHKDDPQSQEQLKKMENILERLSVRTDNRKQLITLNKEVVSAAEKTAAAIPQLTMGW